ncbi:hypothetical protein LTR10_018704 [Elasticomyces elasticus]|uniref:Cytochrome P450 n=1 Tax=Exophiala sideris TaxID=1016849 RepID=A0ABR0JB34_9EURO|nr:hypothetical protein LTR10_018704 [Elasticomyces elasticus]KAK5026261.1 hypothetical protein LTS07_007786 [Exophiala sideris]KAK5032514.1 hypothetical protein LTR13_007337 [Exophiala sideris]KAK5059673.1 hypothetical protein LTR69_006262 [Exophiala sideris]KAK5178044.1 hypothetical protein LTR44_009350 [Eurotiomycetes sp. CCFEE 6388]
MELRCVFQQSAPTSWQISVTLAVLLSLRFLWVGIYRIFFHPLARYPGPIVTKLSNIPMTIWNAQSQSTYARYKMHQKYGRIVRTGPNELCFSDTPSIKDIYGQSTEPCLKAPFFYDGFTLTGRHSVFSETNRASHSRMRRLLSHGFSQQGTMQSQEDIIKLITKFLDLISLSSNQVNIHDHVHHLFLDTTSHLSFGKSFDLLSGIEHHGARDIETYFSISPLFGVFPVAKYIPVGVFRAAREARPRIVASVQVYINEFRDRLRLGTAQHGLLRQMVEASDGESGTAFSDEELIENAVLFIIAGSGTTATTLLYFIYEVGKRPEIKACLEREIRDAFPAKGLFPSFNTANDLRYCD